MAHSTIRATILPEIIKLICNDKNVSEQQALDMFYTSKTGESFADDETGLYGQSPLYIYGLFKEETEI
ncbi:MAG: hypothetical protein NC037_04330 [Bacteroides sp.]|nr:hypothetical protein [Bacillota bacterium]MCM1393292.1 hypothetical protein [[Eubacterium] siraeum]MCM1455738.1 hypothetical protein [Bacteroides sp.]